MIAFIRASFTGAAVTDPWADDVANNWFDPSIPFSLAHFWKQTTFHQVDTIVHVFPPVQLPDPRHNPPTHPDRTVLVEKVLNEVDRVSKPDWDLFDCCFIYFSHAPVDCFGGGSVRAPNGKYLLPAVFDSNTRFDLACQETGHAFGLQHEIGALYLDWTGHLTTEYGCPYSVMSAMRDITDVRPIDPRLPGLLRPGMPQHIVGPYIPAAHLYINQYRRVNPQGVFNHPDSVAYVSASYEHTPQNVKLVARDVAISAWPTRKTVLAVLPPIVPSGDTHFLELRRHDNSYDGGLTSSYITILAANFFQGAHAAPDPAQLRIRYVDRIDLDGVQGDLDYHSFSGHFVVRVNSFQDDYSSVHLTVGGGEAWKDFTARLETPVTNSQLVADSEWRSAVVAPCPSFPPREYRYRTHTFTGFQVFRAYSTGYELPAYAWYLGAHELDATVGTPGIVHLDVLCRTITDGQVSAPSIHNVQFTYAIGGGRLELSVADAFADINIDVRVTANEGSPSVMKNLYPERSAAVTVKFDNLQIEWDDNYQRAWTACWQKYLRNLSDIVIPIDQVKPRRDRRPQYNQRVPTELVRDLNRDDPRAAHSLASRIAKELDVSVDTVLDDAFREDHT